MKLTIFYDNHCPNCTSFVKQIKKLDWLQLIESKQLRNISETNQYPEINLELAKQQMASYNKNWNYGFKTIFLILVRIPLFWCITPILYLLQITTIGQKLYIELAQKRKIIPIHCDNNVCNI
jgi:predicted DCC family thiol-disulfide oxidoreductase YuxK